MREKMCHPAKWRILRVANTEDQSERATPRSVRTAPEAASIRGHRKEYPCRHHHVRIGFTAAVRNKK
jgi:hypothetical protein